jgi:hypothetical protein
LPDEAYFFDDGTYHNAANIALPPRTPSLSLSLGEGTREYLSNHLQERVRYYTDRARMLDSRSTLTADEASGILQRRHTLFQSVHSRVSILVWDCTTATSDDVVKTMNDAVLMLGNAHIVNFSRANAIVLKYHHALQCTSWGTQVMHNTAQWITGLMIEVKRGRSSSEICGKF